MEMKNLQFMLTLIIIGLVLTRPVFAEPHDSTHVNLKIWDSLLVPDHGIEIYEPYITTNGSVAFLHFHVYGTCSGACGVNCPFETYAGFLSVVSTGVLEPPNSGWFFSSMGTG
ncbi:hypothetical protein [Thermococcus sp.]|uniref:hypothetical protein n=1 Tax=Thermococcus sp. TaxID=35749 RepID=UPI0026049DCF|nr:hypothetical protein [Thermococcus sp.]